MNKTQLKTTHKNIDLIDIFKSFAIISVIYLHSGFSERADKILFAPFYLYLAVPIFMIVSGFTYSISFAKYNNGKSVLKSYYSFKNIYNKLIRILPCYLLVFAAEMIVDPFHFDSIRSIVKFVYYLCTGGYNYQGSYYIPILIQLIIVFPVLKVLYSRMKEKSFIPVVVFCLIYEFLMYYFDISYDIQRLIIIRYLVYILSGIFVFDKFNERKITHKALYVISFLLGVTWIVAINYFDYTPKFFFSEFLTTSFPCALFLVPIILVLLRKIGNVTFPYIFKIFGKASYHIYLMQMVYFGMVRNRLNFINVDNNITNFIVGVTFSAVTGIILYYAEMKITKLIRKNLVKAKEL